VIARIQASSLCVHCCDAALEAGCVRSTGSCNWWAEKHKNTPSSDLQTRYKSGRGRKRASILSLRESNPADSISPGSPAGVGAASALLTTRPPARDQMGGVESAGAIYLLPGGGWMTASVLLLPDARDEVGGRIQQRLRTPPRRQQHGSSGLALQATLYAGPVGVLQRMRPVSKPVQLIFTSYP
jgi:hypothetical protein